MARRELSDAPLFWQEAASEDMQALIAKRRHRYVVNAVLLEQAGFRPAAQVTMESGRLLRSGETDVVCMVEGAVRYTEESRIARMFEGEHLEFRRANGAVVPLVDPKKINGPSGFRATRRGFTIYVRKAIKSEHVAIPVSVASSIPAQGVYAGALGNSVANPGSMIFVDSK